MISFVLVEIWHTTTSSVIFIAFVSYLFKLYLRIALFIAKDKINTTFTNTHRLRN